MNPENPTNKPKATFGGGPQKAILAPPLAEFDEQVKKRLREIQSRTPVLYPLFYRVYARQTGLAKAVKAKCLDCACWQRQEITFCRVTTCPLHAFRPFQKAGEADEDGLAESATPVPAAV